jgi:hypothetical protein
MKTDELQDASANIGFVIATINALTSKPGVSMDQIRQALGRLDDTLELIGKYYDKRHLPQKERT